MNILFLTITRITGLTARGIYTDLMRKFRDEGHEVFIACPTERRYYEQTSLSIKDGVHILNIRTLNAQKTNLFEKGVCTLLLDGQFERALKKYYAHVKFDLILYSTPPITFTGAISFIKKRDKAITYLLLKDIFPQNAADLSMISQGGPIYTYFRKKEKRLYAVSDFIGCLSPANVEFLLKHNPAIDPAIIEVNPNTIEPLETKLSTEQRTAIREKYKVPVNAIVFMYGGNLGKPQGIEFLMRVLESNNGVDHIFIIVVGSGTEFPRIYNWYKQTAPGNILVMKGLPKHEYDELVMACDVGLIFLDKRFTIPNFPSRLLSYLENRMPVLAATDVNTDIGKVIEKAGCGFWVESGDLQGFNQKIKAFIDRPGIIQEMGNKGLQLLTDEYTVDTSYSIVMNRLQNKQAVTRN